MDGNQSFHFPSIKSVEFMDGNQSFHLPVIKSAEFMDGNTISLLSSKYLAFFLDVEGFKCFSFEMFCLD